MVVKRAVTNKASTWTPKKCPKIAKLPSTNRASCKRAISAVAPKLQGLTGGGVLRKAKAIYSSIASEAIATPRIALLVISRLTAGPTELNEVSVRFCCPSKTLMFCLICWESPSSLSRPWSL